MKSTHPYPAPTMSPADIAAHRAASYTRPPRPGDSDPDPDEALRRARGSFGICDFCGKPSVAGHACANLSPHGIDAVRLHLETEAAYILRDRQTWDATRAEMAGAA